jgi:hypothetical protein
VFELSSSIKQFTIKLGFGPVFDKEVWKYKLVSISGEHFSATPMAPDSIKFLTDEPAFWISTFFPSFCKHQLDVNISGGRAKFRLLLVVGRFIVKVFKFGKWSKTFVSTSNETAGFWFLFLFVQRLPLGERLLWWLKLSGYCVSFLGWLLPLFICLAFEPLPFSKKELHRFFF